MDVINIYSILGDVVLSFMSPDRGIYQLNFVYAHLIWKSSPVF